MPTDEGRWRDLLEAVVGNLSSGILISDERGVLIVANHAAQSLLGGEISRALGVRASVAQTEIIKWRFTNPEDYEGRLVEAIATGSTEAWEEETVEGRVLSISCSALATVGGDSLGSVQLLSDVTDARRELNDAIAEARRRLELVEQRERLLEERAALTNAAYQMAGAMTAEEIYRRLMAEAARISGAGQLAVFDAVQQAGRQRGVEVDAPLQARYLQGLQCQLHAVGADWHAGHAQHPSKVHHVLGQAAWGLAGGDHSASQVLPRGFLSNLRQ